MPHKTETMASHLVRDLYEVTDGRPMQWRAIGGMADGSDIQAAVQLAVQKGWMLLEGSHSVCLTDEGRKQVEYKGSLAACRTEFSKRDLHVFSSVSRRGKHRSGFQGPG